MTHLLHRLAALLLLAVCAGAAAQAPASRPIDAAPAPGFANASEQSRFLAAQTQWLAARSAYFDEETTLNLRLSELRRSMATLGVGNEPGSTVWQALSSARVRAFGSEGAAIDLLEPSPWQTRHGRITAWSIKTGYVPGSWFKAGARLYGWPGAYVHDRKEAENAARAVAISLQAQLPSGWLVRAISEDVELSAPRLSMAQAETLWERLASAVDQERFERQRADLAQRQSLALMRATEAEMKLLLPFSWRERLSAATPAQLRQTSGSPPLPVPAAQWRALILTSF